MISIPALIAYLIYLLGGFWLAWLAYDLGQTERVFGLFPWVGTLCGLISIGFFLMAIYVGGR